MSNQHTCTIQRDGLTDSAISSETAFTSHHKLCHTLGGTFNLPHTAHYNHGAAPDALARVARALGGKRAADAGPLLFELNRALGIPMALAQIGMAEQGRDEAADLACKNPYANPRPVARDAIRALLQRAWQGAEPA
ncbi:iron-containing alcohol dehydrogenase [Paraburkholderia sp. Cpub6]|uniref:iron-containing alcohol dehydrogenase n=1 Tax=Paraburkholderia sp. Cpub6 TaxID=2723094 RepID=UPI001829A7E9|nr:iron-containing alcohol dehydrogenase [Paraburkholderia sp. Cpub6]MBB5458025.1 alcohol dehydrogenase class IV [Paraburkholderia sp. Cpub6]